MDILSLLVTEFLCIYIFDDEQIVITLKTCRTLLLVITWRQLYIML